MVRSGSLCSFLSCLAVAMLVAAATAPCASATEADMDLLPVVEPFLCLICHYQESPNAASFELNPFGLDFLANGRRWDASLAILDSDGDGCRNGVELGDADGSGWPDGNVSSLSSNPGVPGDCGGLVIDAHTWGTLKALFDRR